MRGHAGHGAARGEPREQGLLREGMRHACDSRVGVSAPGCSPRAWRVNGRSGCAAHTPDRAHALRHLPRLQTHADGCMSGLQGPIGAPGARPRASEGSEALCGSEGLCVAQEGYVWLRRDLWLCEARSGGMAER